MCFAVCRGHPQGHVAVYPGTRLSARKALRPIFSVLICVISELIGLLNPLWSCDRFRPVSSCDGDLTLSAGITFRYAVHFLSQQVPVIFATASFHEIGFGSLLLVVGLCRMSRLHVSSGMFLRSHLVFAS
jgi:hypothetical protein